MHTPDLKPCDETAVSGGAPQEAPPKVSSQWTPRWREMDSNPRSPVVDSIFRDHPGNPATANWPGSQNRIFPQRFKGERVVTASHDNVGRARRRGPDLNRLPSAKASVTATAGNTLSAYRGRLRSPT